MMMSNPPSNCFPSARALLETCAQFYSSFAASTSFSLAVRFSRRLPSLLVSQSDAPSFLTQVESDAACAIAREHDLPSIHAESVRSARPAGQDRFGNGKNRRASGHTGRGRGMSQLNRHFNSAQPSAQSLTQQLAQPSAKQSDHRQDQR